MIARLTPLLLVALLSGSCRESTEKTGSSSPSETQNRGRSSRDEGATESVTALARSEFDEGLSVRIAKLRKEEVIELVKLSEADRYVPGKGHIFNFAIAELAKRDADLALSFFEPGSIKARDPGLVGVFPYSRSRRCRSAPVARCSFSSSSLSTAVSIRLTKKLATLAILSTAASPSMSLP